MSLKPIVENLEGIAEALAAHYKPGTGTNEGKYVLDVTPDGSFELADTAGLKSALAKERTAAEEARKVAKAFEGIDPTAARDALGKVAEIDSWDPDKKLAEHKAKYEKDLAAQYEAQSKQVTDKLEAEIARVSGVNEKLLGNVRRMAVTNAARAALAEHGGNAELLLPHVESQVVTDFDEEAGSIAVKVVDGNGHARISPSGGSTDLMSISELVGTMKNDDKYKAAFAGSGASGGGATGAGVKVGPGGTRVISRDDGDGMSASLEDIASGKVKVDMG